MTYKIQCKCNDVQISLHNKPILHAYCHCNDCRDLLDIPYHSVVVWSEENISIDQGLGSIAIYQHPSLKMQKHFCAKCGDVLFNTNGVMGWRVVSQLLIARCNKNTLPTELASNRHFFYEQRIINVNDDLPKYLRGSNGALFE